MFDPRHDEDSRYGRARAELRQLLSADEYAAAQRSTVNAHYTDPVYVAAIWDGLRQLGFDGGTVLEPGCGLGNFFDRAPEGASLIGVELDPTSAALARAVHARAEIRNESFADSDFADATADLVVGNVPFGDYVLNDAQHNPKRHRIHNHFILKGLHLLRPGGLLVAITSRYTMDSASAAARQDMDAVADFLGAIRLPTGAHREQAGTDVVTDVLFFRRRPEGQEPRSARFLETVEFGRELRINAYFAEYDTNVLGELFVDQADRGRAELGVKLSGNIQQELSAAVTRVTSDALKRGLRFERFEANNNEIKRVSKRRKEGEYALTVQADGTFTERRDGADVAFRVPSTQVKELRMLLDLRDTLTDLLAHEAATLGESAEVTELRNRLNEIYDRYVVTYGPLNRFSERRTGRSDDDGAPVLARIRPPQGGFRQDPMAPAVYALERFNEEAQTADKASIFRGRVLQRSPVKIRVDSPVEALQIVLDRVGHIDLLHVGELLGVSPEEAKEALADLVFADPETAELVTRAEYLSGNVREKLVVAKAAAVRDAHYTGNVTALQGALPPDIEPAAIRVNLGAAWIDAEYVQEFLRELLRDKTVVVEHGMGPMWSIAGNGSSVEAADTWGTPYFDALEIAQALCEQKSIRVFDRLGNLDQTQTTAAIAKATALEAEFRSWIWRDESRADRLCTKYNELFNSEVTRTYSAEGMTLPGLAVSFQPHDYQLAAVAHCLSESRVGLFHDVGLGKTATMVMATMKAKMLDPTRKAAVVVPNHMLDQFAREWLQMYPQANILAIGTDDLSSPAKRKMFIAKCSLSNWDAVIITMAAFEKIATRDAAKLYMEEQLEHLNAELLKHREKRSDMTVKRLEAMKLRLEEKYKALLATDRKDDGLSFERTGINALVIDELHLFKNLMTPSAIQGIAISGSNRATDLHLKLWHLARAEGSRRRRGLMIGATATPLSNNIIENHVIMRYLAPDKLKRVGIQSADQFVATFTEKKNAVEVSPTGEMRMKERISGYVNVPELWGIWAPFASICRADQTKLNLPKLRVRADGRRAPEVVLIQRSAAIEWFMAEVGERADNIRRRRVEPSQDNHLKLASDGRRVALDFRLLDPAADVGVQKVDVASARIAQIYHDTRDHQYLTPEGDWHPRKGALQIVFADLGTPKDDGTWSLYEEFRKQLAARGVPPSEVRFVHEAKNDKQKAELFRKCREGEVAVLLGSTEKMGVGTNIQTRAVALHHIDVPYRPSDVTQREGRILRQGNQNPEVEVLRYATEGSFDGYVWQLVTMKNEHQQGFLHGDKRVRTLSSDAADDVQLSLQEIKALATGNPLLMEHAECLAEMKRLEALEEAHHSSIRYREGRRREAESRIRCAERAIERVEHAGATIDDVFSRPGALDKKPSSHAELGVSKAFRVVVGGVEFDEQAPANRALVYEVGVLRNRFMVRWKTDARAAKEADEFVTEVGKLGPFAIIVASPRHATDAVVVSLKDAPTDEIQLASAEAYAQLKAGSMLLVQRLVNQLRKLPEQLQYHRLELKMAKSELVRAQEAGGPADFPHATELLTKRLRLAEIDRELAASAAAPKKAVAFRDMPDAERAAYAVAVNAEYEEKRAGCCERTQRFATRWVDRAERRCLAAESALREASAPAARDALHDALRRTNENLRRAREFASDADGRLTKRAERKLQRAHGPLAKLREEIREWQRSAASASTESRPSAAPVERWQAALKAAEDAIVKSARLVCRRIEERRSTLKSKLQAHRAARPQKLFNKPVFEAWVKRDEQIQMRIKELAAAASRMTAFLEESDVPHSSRRALAVRRLEHREPELVRELTAHRIATAREIGVAKHEHQAARTR